MNDTISQLNTARGLALTDAAYYPQIVPSVLPIIGANANLDLRRWGSEFLAETFSSPLLGVDEKRQLSLGVLDTLKGYLEVPGEDTAVVKNVVQTAASIFPLVFRHIINNPHDSATWQKMAAIKSNILRRMDSSPPGVRVCCIKFIQRVVQTQTPGVISDPRRPENNELSSALVPRDHPVIPPPQLEAEASGLLDRLLGILQEEVSDALMVTATMNILGSLIRYRPTIANKIISVVLNFNPFRLAQFQPFTPKTKVMIRSMERTMRSLLVHLIKKNPHHPLGPRIQQAVERLQHTRLEMLEEANRKRPAPTEPTDGLDHAKRQRLGAEVTPAPNTHSSIPPQPSQPPQPPQGRTTIAQLFTLTQDKGSASFDVRAIPIDVVNNLLIPILSSIDKNKMNNAINAVRGRYLSLSRAQQQQKAIVAAAASKAVAAPEDDDDYEPDYQPTEDAEQILNQLDNAPPDPLVPPDRAVEVTLGSFEMPQPPPLTDQEIMECSRNAINRVFGTMGSFDEGGSSKPQKRGFSRLAASSHDRDAWITIITRLATRSTAGLENGTSKVKSEEDPYAARVRRSQMTFSDSIRETLYMYIIEDFRRRIDVAISWLCEEWYNDRIQSQNGEEPTMNYDKWAKKVLDGMVPYLDAKDKVLIRFLSEIPQLDRELLDRVKRLASDPERVTLAVSAIHYLIILRPPVREMCLDALEDLWRNYEDARPSTAKLLTKWRPQALQETVNGAGGEVKAEA
ncbi:hypothetical protein M501DRAFT_267523 [Patellaria atrata CBS 101060]|uniref:Symplekin/Pta1 N-terminal domain-containing protein n=1 Tax=Patellaria atrata CBS 101060 TaxID=1346257 RepID=A0A9P4VNJ2_9PEZI|nr:hypothetical protein M501DRAFT_267523 [Patellaria atrata CBS 101060]